MTDYRVIVTDERIGEGAIYLLGWRARREARRLNADRIAVDGYGPTYEWRVVQRGCRHELVAFRCRLEELAYEPLEGS